MTSTTLRGVSVIVPHYGDPALATELVGELKAQQFRGQLELIVVDDASPVPFPAQPGVTVERRTENGGFGAAVNTGARVATQRLLLVLNSDLHLAPDFVERLVEAAAPLEPAVVGPRLVTAEGSPTYNARRFPRTRHFVVEWLVSLARFRNTHLWHRAVGHDLRSATSATFETDWLVGAALLIPRRDFLSAGGFDTRFHMNSEEVDLQVRLRRAGLRSFFVGSVVCSHDAGSSSGRHSERLLRVVESRLRYAEKWGGAWAGARLQLALTVASAANCIWRIGRRATGRVAHPIAETAAELQLLRRARATCGRTR